MKKPGKDLGAGIKPDFYNERPEEIDDDITTIIYGNKKIEKLAEENKSEFNNFTEEYGEDYFGD